jgi:uncharacterized protein (TIGR02246 family)
MNPLISSAITLATAAMLVVPAAAADQHPDASAITAAASSWAEAFNRGDLEAVVDLYTSDAQLLPEGGEPIVGKAAILEFFEKLREAQPQVTIHFTRFEFYGRDPQVTEYSVVEIRDAHGALQSRSKQVLIRLKQNGQWKIHRDIWTSNGDAKRK